MKRMPLPTADRGFASRSGLLPIAVVLFLSGVVGWVIGTSTPFLDWQTIVEVGQVFAGKVPYPAFDIPHYAMLSQPWTFCGQLCGLLLYGGFSEAAVSYVVAGITGMIAFQSLGLLFYVISRHVTLSVLIPFFVLKMSYVGYGVSYPIRYMGTGNTAGRLGLGLTILTCAFFAGGYYRFAVFLLGISFAIHASLAIFVFGILFVIFFLFRKATPPLRRLAGPFFSGLLVSIASYIYQKTRFGMPTAVDPERAGEYAAAFIAHWDYHRTPFDYCSPGFFIAVLSGLVCWRLLSRSGDYPARIRITAAIFAVAFCASALLSLITYSSPAFFTWLHVLMPGRFINLNNYAYVTFLLAFLIFAKDAVLSCRALFSFFVLASLFILVPIELGMVRTGQTSFARNGLVAVSSLAFIVLISCREKIEPQLLRFKKTIDHLYRLAVAGLAALMCVGFPAYIGTAVGMPTLTVTDPVLIKTAAGKGLLLISSGCDLIPTKTRRPILLNPDAVDALPYVPTIGGRTNAVLKAIYGVDIFIPPPKRYRNQGGVAPELYKDLWERRSAEEWVKIGREFGVNEILTAADWHLRLPCVMRSGAYCLYALQDERGAATSSGAVARGTTADK